jgi:hypothetical protein
MQNSIGAGGDAFDTDLSGCGMEQGEQFSGPVLHIFMGLLDWLSFRLPMMPRIGNGLIGSGFVLREVWQSLLLSYGIRLFDEFFFSASIWISDLDRPTFAHTKGLARVAPGAIFLPRIARFM